MASVSSVPTQHSGLKLVAFAKLLPLRKETAQGSAGDGSREKLFNKRDSRRCARIPRVRAHSKLFFSEALERERPLRWSPSVPGLTGGRRPFRQARRQFAATSPPSITVSGLSLPLGRRSAFVPLRCWRNAALLRRPQRSVKRKWPARKGDRPPFTASAAAPRPSAEERTGMDVRRRSAVHSFDKGFHKIGPIGVVFG